MKLLQKKYGSSLMLNFNKILLITSFTAAIFSAVFCSLLLFLKLIKEEAYPILRKVILLLIGFYVLSITYFVVVFYFLLYANKSSYSGSLRLQVLILIPVVFYHIVFNATKIDKGERFNIMHYLLPISLGIGYLVYTELPVFVTWSKGLGWIVDGEVDFLLLGALFLVYSVVYTWLWGKREDNYRAMIVVSHRGNSQLLLFEFYRLYFAVILLFQSLIFFQFISAGKGSLYGQPLLNAMMLLLHVALCYNVFKGRIAIVSFLWNMEVLPDQEDMVLVDRQGGLKQQVFEEYMDREKPFLNPNLLIVDLIGPLQTNRSYLSAFINKTYGMNFRLYINNRRLKEFEKLYLQRTEHEKEVDIEDLVLQSGFKSMESFRRVRDDKMKVIQ